MGWKVECISWINYDKLWVFQCIFVTIPNWSLWILKCKLSSDLCSNIQLSIFFQKHTDGRGLVAFCFQECWRLRGISQPEFPSTFSCRSPPWGEASVCPMEDFSRFLFNLLLTWVVLKVLTDISMTVPFRQVKEVISRPTRSLKGAHSVTSSFIASSHARTPLTIANPTGRGPTSFSPHQP